MKIFQRGFNFRQDGPGNRLVYHLQGCNMHCIWCSNPEGMNPDGGSDRSVDDIFDEISRSRMMFFSGGGVTFTGGEATLQHKELGELLKKCHEAGIHTAIETNGTSVHLPELLPFVDYLMMDFKHYDSEILRRYTRVGNEIIKQNYEKICAMGRQYHVRIPLIREFNASDPERDAERFASYFASADTTNVRFEFLPYHEYGKEKWKEEYLVKQGFVDKETIRIFRETFEKHGLPLIVT